MNTRLIAVALCATAWAWAGPARGQEVAAQGPATAFSGITAQGHGEVKVQPDIARVTITVTTQSRDQAEAVRRNAVRTTAMLAALRGAGIADKDIQTQSYTVQPQYNNASPPALRGFQVQNSVEATVRDLTKVGAVIDAATQGGASEIGDVSFDLSDQAQAECQALSQAVAAAKRKAGVMASAAGVDLGRLLSITEGTSAPVERPMFAARTMAAAASTPETPINDQQITVDADATLVYALGAAK